MCSHLMERLKTQSPLVTPEYTPFGVMSIYLHTEDSCLSRRGSVETSLGVQTLCFRHKGYEFDLWQEYQIPYGTWHGQRKKKTQDATNYNRFLPGECQGRGSLVGCRLWGCTESDTTEATQQQQQQHGRWNSFQKDFRKMSMNIQKRFTTIKKNG